MAVPANSTRTPVAHDTSDIHPDDMPEQYAIVINGSDETPEMAGGIKQVFSTVIPPATGDIVALWFKPGVIGNSGHQLVAFRLVKPAPAWAKFNWNYNPGCKDDPKVIVKTLRNPRQLTVRINDLSAIHTWVGPLPVDRETYTHIIYQQEREANKEVVAVTSNNPAAQTELPLLTGSAGEPLTMSSREIAELTEKRHDHVVRDIRVMLDAVLPGWEKDPPKLGHQGISITYDNRGYVSEIRLPKDLTITLVAGYDANLRLKIIRRWMELEEAIKQPAKPAAPEFPIPQTFAEALMLAANQAAQIEHQKTRIVEKDAQIIEMKPKAEFHDAFLNADGLYGLQNAARSLNLRPNLFIRWLKSKYLFYQGGDLVPYIQYRQSDIFDVKSETVDGKVHRQTYITPKGLAYLNARVPDNLRLKKVSE